MSKIYSSLGFPDLTDEEIKEFYNTRTDLYDTYCPYDDAYISGVSDNGIKFVNSTTAETTEMEWLYRENGAEQRIIDGSANDYLRGELTYTAKINGNHTIIGIDESVSNEETEHHLGGVLHDNIIAYLNGKRDDGDFDNQMLISLSHRNVLPHFEGEDSLLKDFTFYNTFETADMLADMGVRYAFSGHMHANDIHSRISLNGNLITDVQTSSITGFNAALRLVKIERGQVGDDYAENYTTHLCLIPEVDITNLVEMGFIDDAYLDRYDLNDVVTVKGGKTIITDPATYAGNKLLLKIVENMIYEDYVNVDFIGSAGDFVAGILPDNTIVNMIKPLAADLVDNLVRHLEVVVLKDYTYGGDNPEFKGTEHGAKLCGYVDELLQTALNMPVNSEGLGLFDFVINAYMDHIGGRDVAYEDLDDGMKEAMDLFKDGTNVKKLVDILLDENSGLLRIVKGLFEPIDLAYGMSASDEKMLGTVLGSFLAVRLM